MGILEKLEEKALKIKEVAAKKVADAQAEEAQLLLELDEEKAMILAYGKSERDAGFDEGIAQSGIPAGDKIYTEDDYQKGISEAVAPFLEKQAVLETKVANQEAKVAELQSVVDSVPAQIKSAKVQLWEKVKAVKADDSALAAEIDAELA